MSSLCGQVVWQKYLAILFGSEARSISLVVAVFLFGLASGYYFFGKLTERRWSRCFLMKIYGYIELATAIYFIVFYLYFQKLELLNFNFPAYLVIDILVSFLALFLPTFLMGASIPLLTATLPEGPEEVNSVHAHIYGWNTLGAFFGTLISAFILIPNFGFALTLTIAGIVNFLAGLIFLANVLKGDVKKREDIALIPSSLSNRFLMIFVFLTGAVVISCEILFVRLLNVSIGARVYNFPIALSIFIGGLGLGSLLIPKKISSKFFIKQIMLSSLFLIIAFLTGPYWGIWISHFRVALNSIAFNYWFFNVEVYLFLFLFIFPIAFFMGRLLPLAYSFLKKHKEDYGRLCGFLYFSNTLGTVFGAVILGYVAFYFFNLDYLFKINLFILLSLIAVISFFEKARIPLISSVVLVLGLFFIPKWDRAGHVVGYLRLRSPVTFHFKKWFNIPKRYSGEIIFFKDGPNSAVAVTENKKAPFLPEIQKFIPEVTGDYMVSVNSKPVGSLLGSDFSTIMLISSFGYLFAPEKSELSAGVIGLGTGFSAGILGKLPDVKEVDVLEISSQVVKGVRSVSSYNLDVMSNPKVNVIANDAFRYFTRTDKTFDIVVSEPSNPWVMGVENLFTLEFYEMIQKKLNPGGVLIQWFHTYSIDDKALQMVFHTIKQVFKFSELYVVNSNDILILSSLTPFQKENVWKKRFLNPVLYPIHEAMGLREPEDLYLLKIFGRKRLSNVSKSYPVIHSLTQPKLTYRADKAFFMGKSVSIFNASKDYFFETELEEKTRSVQFEKYIKKTGKEINDLCRPLRGFRFFCNMLNFNVRHYRRYQNTEISIYNRLRSYSELRKRGFIVHNSSFLKQVKQSLIKDKAHNIQLLIQYINQILSQKNFKKALDDVSDFEVAGLLGEEGFKESLIDYISKVKSSLQ